MDNLTLSFELILFLQWLLENKKDLLKDLVSQGIKAESFQACLNSHLNTVGAQHNIKGFVEFLEQELRKGLHDSDSLETSLREQLSELAESMDLSSFDDTTILNGFKQAKKQISRINIPCTEYGLNKFLFKTVLMQTILDNWRPGKAAAQA